MNLKLPTNQIVFLSGFNKKKENSLVKIVQMVSKQFYMRKKQNKSMCIEIINIFYSFQLELVYRIL